MTIANALDRLKDDRLKDDRLKVDELRGEQLNAWPVVDGKGLLGMIRRAELEAAVAGGLGQKDLLDLFEALPARFPPPPISRTSIRTKAYILPSSGWDRAVSR